MADDIGALLVKLQADISQLKAELTEAKGQLSGFQTTATEFGSSIKSALTIAVGALGIYELGSALKNAFKQGIEAADEYRLTTIGVAATLTDLAKDGTDYQKAYSQNIAYSKQMYNELELAAAKHFASGKDMVQAWNILSQKGIVLRREEIHDLGTIVDKIKLATAGQVQGIQIAQELRAMLSGQSRQTDQLAIILKDRYGKAWEEIVKKQREAGTLIPWLADEFKGLKFASEDVVGTLTAQKTTLETLLRQVGRGGLASAFEDIVRFLREINDYLTVHKDDLVKNILSAWWGIKQAVTDISNIIDAIKKKLAAPINWTINIVGSAAAILSGAGGAGGDFGFGALSDNYLDQMQKTARKLTQAHTGQYWKNLGEAQGGFFMLLPGQTEPSLVTSPLDAAGTRKMAGDTGKGSAAKSRVSAWQSELEEMKTAENAYFNFSKERELEFWREKLRMVEEGSDEYIQVKHRIFAVEKEIARDSLKEQIADLKLQQEFAKDNGNERLRLQDEILKKLAGSYGKESTEYKNAARERVKIAHDNANTLLEIEKKRIETQRELVKVDLDLQRENLSLRRNLGLITAAQEFSQLMALKRQEIQLERETLQQKLAELEKYGKRYTKEYAEIKNKLQILEKKETLELTKLNNQRMLALKAQWDQLWGSVSRAFSQSLQGILTGTTTLADALKNIWQSILSSFVEMVLQMVMQWVAAQLFQLVYGKATATAQIGTRAGPVYMENLLALIPELGPWFAPEAAGILTGLEVANAMALSSAAGGWDVPEDSFAMIHKKEMVLPENLADRIRNMTAPGGGGGNIGAIHLNFPNVKNLTRQTIRREVIPEVEKQLGRKGYKLGSK